MVDEAGTASRERRYEEWEYKELITFIYSYGMGNRKSTGVVQHCGKLEEPTDIYKERKR